MNVVAAGKEAHGKTSDCVCGGELRTEDEFHIPGEVQADADFTDICQQVYISMTAQI